MDIKVGQVIRSFDFPHTTDFYMVGEVTEVDTVNRTITCNTLGHVSGGKVEKIRDINSTFRTVFPGDHVFDNMFKTPRIQILDPAI